MTLNSKKLLINSIESKLQSKLNQSGVTRRKKLSVYK